MFSDLLRALADQRPRTMAELAGELGADPARVRLALDHFQQSGYLERLGAGCEVAACSGCPIADACQPATSNSGGGAAPGTGPTWWRLTDSGRRVAGAGAPPGAPQIR
jgi:hypothetical protein